MHRCSFCAWIPILPWPVWPLAGHARLGQNTVVGSMTILLSWLCWGACQEKVCLDPCFLCNLTPPRFSVELPATEREDFTMIPHLFYYHALLTVSKKWTCDLSMTRVASWRHILETHMNRFALILQVHDTKPLDDLA